MLSRIAAIKPYLFQSLRNNLFRRIRRQWVISDIRDGRTKLEMKVPKSLLNTSGEPDFEFKWSDNMQNDGDCDGFLPNGDAALAGRGSYYDRP